MLSRFLGFVGTISSGAVGGFKGALDFVLYEQPRGRMPLADSFSCS